uniref:Interleukin 6 signal transducer n=1 Tax=Cynoglossus semilaevis TaxID=244447 RepID=A0A3P8WP93_CYNSE
MSTGALQLLLLACFTSPFIAGNHLLTAPHPNVLEIGTNFTASCMIINTTEVTSDDLYWIASETTVPKEQYTKVNNTTLNVTIQVSGENSEEWLFCRSRKVSNYVELHEADFVHAILLRKAYSPMKPENLSCIALLKEDKIAATVTCSWNTVGRQINKYPTMYTLHFKIHWMDINYNVKTNETSATVSMDVFPFYMEVHIWVEAHNILGVVQSDVLKHNADSFVKLPPVDVMILSESSFPTTLLLNWSRPIAKQYSAVITYEIRYCQSGANTWTDVPTADIREDIESFRIQDLVPDTVYVIQLRCKKKNDYGYWSDWSTNATQRTLEDRTFYDDTNRFNIVCDSVCQGCFCLPHPRDPLSTNGKILRFDVSIQEHKDKAMIPGSKLELSVPVNRSDDSTTRRPVTALKEILLKDKTAVRVLVFAINSVGKSPRASLIIPEKELNITPGVLPRVESMRAWPDDGKLWVEWKAPNDHHVTEYVVEWVTGDVIDWQRENRNTTKTFIKGDLQKFVRYTVSVYPLHNDWPGSSASVQAYLEEGAPLQGPSVRLKGKPGRSEAELVWSIPQSSLQGFIRTYIISYTSGMVPSNTTTYTLTSLIGNTKYDVWVTATTTVGSTEGNTPGEIEWIVVGVSFAFLFVVIMTVLLCTYKKDMIKRNFWPEIPNPGESTIGNWSPDYSLRAEAPKENCLSGISVLDVDACDEKCVFEEDKPGLPLKKDKYLSEEHSSGIGGSSCMSSPRQSVSDSDEGGDIADTTASTVQYSSVVASSGYKGQTPNFQPQPSQTVFLRSESTQPLLDSEENPDLSQEGSRQSQCFLRHAAGNRNSFNQLLETEQPEDLENLDFCPLEEDTQQLSSEDQVTEHCSASGPPSSYTPQLGGYRPQ